MSTCKTCKGSGHSRETRPTVKIVAKKHITIAQGSGCPTCLGTGIKGERNVHTGQIKIAPYNNPC